MKRKCVFIIVLIFHISNVVGTDGAGTLFWKEHCINKTDENQATVKLIMEDVVKHTQEMTKKFDDIEVVYLEVDIEANRGHENELFETEIFINVNDCSRHDEVNGSMTNDAFHWASIRNFMMRMPKKSGLRDDTISDVEVDGEDLILSKTYRPSFKPLHCFNKTREKLNELIAIRNLIRKLMVDLQGKYKELAIGKIQLDIEAVNLKDLEVSYTTVVMNVNDCSEYHTNYTWWSSPSNITSANETADTGPGKGNNNHVNNNAGGQDGSNISNNNSTAIDAADKVDKNNSTGIKSDADGKEKNSTIDESNGKQNKKNTNGSEDNNTLVDKDGNVTGNTEDTSKGNGTDDDSKVWWVVNPPQHEVNGEQHPDNKNSSENDSKNTDENDSKNTDENGSKNTDENDSKNTDKNDSKNTDENDSNNTDENESKNTDENDSKSREKSEIDSSSINEDDNLYKGKSTKRDSKKNVFGLSTLGYIESNKNEEDDADYTGSASSSADIKTSSEHKEEKIKPIDKTKVLSGSTVGIIENHESKAIDEQIYGEFYDSTSYNDDNEYKDVELEGNDLSVNNNEVFEDKNEDIKRIKKLRNKLEVRDKNKKSSKGKSKNFGYTQVNKKRKHKKPGHYKKKMGNNQNKFLLNPNKVKVIF